MTGSLDLRHAKESVEIAARLKEFLKDVDIMQMESNGSIAPIISSMEAHLDQTAEGDDKAAWRVVLSALRTLRSGSRCREIARGAEGSIVEERERLAVLSGELRHCLEALPPGFRPHGLREADFARMASMDANPGELVALLRSLPAPTTYQKAKVPPTLLGGLSPDHDTQKDKDSAPPLVRVVAFLDEVPLVSPQLVRPDLLYTLRFSVCGVNWPSQASRLRLDLMTTCTADNYSISEYAMARPPEQAAKQYEADLQGQIRFAVAQSAGSGPIAFAVRCAFELDSGRFTEVPVIGYSQLDFRVVGPGQHELMAGYRRLDHHLEKLLSRLLKEVPAAHSELPELQVVLDALTQLLGAYAQGAVFKKATTLSEAQFQAGVIRDLRLKLGEDVQEHVSQSGGITDLRYRGVIIELKVENQDGDRQQIAAKYSKQAVQYESAEARQVSIVVVLDLTPKELPLADIRNDILLVDVPTHGGAEGAKKYPSKAFIFVVNGNQRSPSAYSR